VTEPDAELLELPFDQYQRYSVAAQLVAALAVPAGTRVLDVGGAPGLVERFLPAHVSYVVDVEAKRHGRYVNADGAALPFPDGSFDVVMSCDSLEHVVSRDRPRFVGELQRASRDLVLLTAPFADPDVALAEAALDDFFTMKYGSPHPMLEEHRRYGLPGLAETEALFRDTGWSAATLPSGLLPRWLAMMLVHEELRGNQAPGLPSLHAYYNAAVGPSDTREPSYRHVIVASCVRRHGDLRRVTDALRAPGDAPAAHAGTQAIASWVFSERLQGVMRAREQSREQTGQVEALRRRFKEREAEHEARHRELEAALEVRAREIADRDAHIVELRLLTQQLRAERRPLSSRAIEQLSNWRRRR